MFAGAGLAACGIIALIVLLLTSSTTPAATMPGKNGHAKSPGQSASEAASPTTASLPASPAGGYPTGTNLGTASETPSRDPFGQPYDERATVFDANAVIAVNEHVLLRVGDNQLDVSDRDADGHRLVVGVVADRLGNRAGTAAGRRRHRGMTLRCRVVWKSARHDTAAAAR